MQLIRSRLYIGFLFLNFFIVAQVTNQRDNELDKKYTPPQSSLFNNLNIKNNQSSSGSDVLIKNVIKFCPTLLFRQKFVFFYEREVAKGFSINAGLGKAFGEDPFEKAFLSLSSNDSKNKQLSAFDLLGSAKFDNSSLFISVGFRLYYSGKSFDGGFVDFNYRNERVDYLLNPTISGYRVEGSTKASFKISAFSFGFGHTFVGGQKNNITHELFMNFGIKIIKFPEYERVDNIVSPITGYSETVYQRTTAEITARILPSINLGYVFGFGF